MRSSLMPFCLMAPYQKETAENILDNIRGKIVRSCQHGVVTFRSVQVKHVLSLISCSSLSCVCIPLTLSNWECAHTFGQMCCSLLALCMFMIRTSVTSLSHSIKHHFRPFAYWICTNQAVPPFGSSFPTSKEDVYLFSYGLDFGFEM